MDGFDPRRQSAPMQTAGEAARQFDNGDAAGMNGLDIANQRIGKKEIDEARQTLLKYKEGKATLDNRIVENEKWFRVRHWECIDHDTSDIEPTSAWLFNSIANKHADAMDNFPSVNILPREEGDMAQAKALSSILPVILDQAEFEEAYDSAWNKKLKSGTGVYGVFWDGSKLGGLGDIAITSIDVLNLFWEPGVNNIQQSPNLFYVSEIDNDVLLSQYPQLTEKSLGEGQLIVSEYKHDDTIDKTKKSLVVDWYYKKANSAGQPVVQFCKFVGASVLVATENDPNMAERGLYDHGKYPFVFDALYRVEDSPAGFGYIDIAKSAQEYIDRGNKAVLKNMLVSATPRYFVRDDGEVNESEFLDIDNPLVHVGGNMAQDSIIQIKPATMPGNCIDVLNGKIEELKEVTGNRDVSTGGTSSGVTAASAIAAMQEAGSKLSRDALKASYRRFREICLMILELIRQFYDIPRCFRIMGEAGAYEFTYYSNAGIKPQGTTVMGMEMGSRVPLFDINITAQKSSPYSKMAQNEMALQLYQLGFFNPMMAVQSLSCLRMMDFDGKDNVIRDIQNAAMLGMVSPMPGAAAGETEQNGGGEEEAATTRNARQRVADSTAPK